MLRADNVPELRDAIRTCSGSKLKSSRAVLDAPDANGFHTGTHVTRIRNPGSPPIHARVQTRFVAVPFEARQNAEAPPLAQPMEPCGGEILLRCRVR